MSTIGGVHDVAVRAWLAPLVLVGVAASWGLSIGVSKGLLEDVPVTDYLSVRYVLGLAILLALRPRVLSTIGRVDISRGAVLGLLFALAQYIQLEGLSRASIVVSSFLVSLYVVFTPLLLSLARRRRPPTLAMAASATALFGVALMSVRGWSFGFGETLTVVAALVYAVHVISVGRWSIPGHTMPLAVVQLAVMAVVFTALALPGGITLPAADDWPAMTYVVLVGGTAIVAQTWAQSRLSAETAAIIMVLEPVWASVFAVLWWNESPDVRTIVGGTLVVVASAAVIIGASRRRRTPATGDDIPVVHP